MIFVDFSSNKKLFQKRWKVLIDWLSESISRTITGQTTVLKKNKNINPERLSHWEAVISHAEFVDHHFGVFQLFDVVKGMRREVFELEHFFFKLNF